MHLSPLLGFLLIEGQLLLHRGLQVAVGAAVTAVVLQEEHPSIQLQGTWRQERKFAKNLHPAESQLLELNEPGYRAQSESR